jgi:hypothetical protein
VDVLGTTDAAGRPAIVWTRTAADSLGTTDAAIGGFVAQALALLRLTQFAAADAELAEASNRAVLTASSTDLVLTP